MFVHHQGMGSSPYPALGPAFRAAIQADFVGVKNAPDQTGDGTNGRHDTVRLGSSSQLLETNDIGGHRDGSTPEVCKQAKPGCAGREVSLPHGFHERGQGRGRSGVTSPAHSRPEHRSSRSAHQAEGSPRTVPRPRLPVPPGGRHRGGPSASVAAIRILSGSAS